MAGVCALGLVLEWYGATSEVPWLFLLAAWVLALGPIAYLYGLWNRAGLRLRLELKSVRPAADSPHDELPEGLLRTGPVPAPIFEGDGMEIEVGLDTSGAARGPAWVRGRIGSKEVFFGTGLVQRSGWRRLRVVRELGRGPVDATVWTVGSGDPLGFFVSRRRCADSEVALVLPRFASLKGRLPVRELEASTAAPRAGYGTELFGIREYRPGDSLRRIHWRSSARHGELVVREYEPPGAKTLRIVCDPAPASAEVADQVARLAASEAWDCIRDGGRVVVGAPGLESSDGSQGCNFWAILEWLARYPSRPSAASGDTSPMRGEEVVGVTAGDPLVINELDIAKGRGAGVRVWAIGDTPVDFDPVERVGTRWPL